MAKKVKIDFTGVQAYKRCEEGIHTAKLVAIDQGTTQGGDDMLKATFEVTKGESQGARVFDNFVLSDKALWKLKLFLTEIGVKSEGKIVLDLEKLVGKTVNIDVTHEEYNGQLRARINSYTSATAAPADDDFDDDNDEEEEVQEEAPKPAEKPKKSAEKKEKKPEKKQPEPEEDDDDWEDDEDWEDA